MISQVCDSANSALHIYPKTEKIRQVETENYPSTASSSARAANYSLMPPRSLILGSFFLPSQLPAFLWPESVVVAIRFSIFSPNPHFLQLCVNPFRLLPGVGLGFSNAGEIGSKIQHLALCSKILDPEIQNVHLVSQSDENQGSRKIWKLFIVNLNYWRRVSWSLNQADDRQSSIDSYGSLLILDQGFDGSTKKSTINASWLSINKEMAFLTQNVFFNLFKITGDF